MEMWQGSQNLHKTQKESHAHNEQMTVVGYIFDTEEMVEVSRSNIQYDGVAAFKLPERSPVLPAFSAKDLPEGSTQLLNVHQIKQINHNPAKSDDNNTPESISNNKNLA